MLGLEWTTDREEQLTKLWADGISATKIAALIGRISRNAIIGKAHRLGLAKRHKTPQRAKNPNAASRARPPYNRPPAPLQRINPSNSIVAKIEAVAAAPGLDERLKGEPPDGTGVQFVGLTENNCHWPLGDPKELDFEFCGKVAIPGMPYCKKHCDLAYRSPEPAKNKQPST